MAAARRQPSHRNGHNNTEEDVANCSRFASANTSLCVICTLAQATLVQVACRRRARAQHFRCKTNCPLNALRVPGAILPEPSPHTPSIHPSAPDDKTTGLCARQRTHTHTTTPTPTQQKKRRPRDIGNEFNTHTHKSALRRIA